VLKGGYPWKDPAFYSTDGLTYTDVTSKFVDETLGSPRESWLTTKADSTFDWIQPNANTGMTPLGAGNALASGDLVGTSVRMDFQTIVVFADGRIALSFLDSTTHYPSPSTGLDQQRPAIAIEQMRVDPGD
jgi:hypothetical protein